MAKLQAVTGLDADVQAGLDGLASGGETEDEAAEPAGGALPRVPRARRRGAAVEPAPPSLEVSPLGGRPPNATHWGVKKRNAMGDWEWQTWSPPGSPVALREFPLSELTYDAFWDRWGAQGGAYEIQWVAATPRGGRRYLRPTKEIQINPREAAAAAAPAGVAAAAPPRGLMTGAVGEAVEMMRLLEGLADQKLTGVMQMMTVLQASNANRATAGISAEELRQIMRDEREAAAREREASEARLRAEIATATAARGEGHGAASEAADVLTSFAGNGLAAQFFRFASQHPSIVEKAIPVVADLGGKLVSVLTPPPVVPRAVPRAVTMAPPPPPPAAAPSLPVAAPPVDAGTGSLSDWGVASSAPAVQS